MLGFAGCEKAWNGECEYGMTMVDYRVIGEVTDEAGTPLSGIRVIVKDKYLNKIFDTESDKKKLNDVSYVMDAVDKYKKWTMQCPDEYKIECEKYKHYVKQLNIPEKTEMPKIMLLDLLPTYTELRNQTIEQVNEQEECLE